MFHNSQQMVFHCYHEEKHSNRERRVSAHADDSVHALTRASVYSKPKNSPYVLVLVRPVLISDDSIRTYIQRSSCIWTLFMRMTTCSALI